jgi:hypothetical protein
MSATQRKDNSHLLTSSCKCPLKLQEDQRQQGQSAGLMNSVIFCPFAFPEVQWTDKASGEALIVNALQFSSFKL